MQNRYSKNRNKKSVQAKRKIYRKYTDWWKKSKTNVSEVQMIEWNKKTNTRNIN